MAYFGQTIAKFPAGLNCTTRQLQSPLAHNSYYFCRIEVLSTKIGLSSGAVIGSYCSEAGRPLRLRVRRLLKAARVAVPISLTKGQSNLWRVLLSVILTSKRVMMVSHFLVLAPEKRVGFGSPVGIKRWYFIKLPTCRVVENQRLRYLRVVDKGFTLNSHVGNTGSNPVGTTIKSITSICLFKTGSVLVSPSLSKPIGAVTVSCSFTNCRNSGATCSRSCGKPLEEGSNITVSRAIHQLPRRCHAGRSHEPLKVQNREQSTVCYGLAEEIATELRYTKYLGEI